MNDTAIDLSASLAADLVVNGNRPVVDPRTLPVRFSRLKKFALSAAHYFESCQAGDDDPSDSLALRLGAGTHAMLFGQPVCRFEGKVRNGKAWEAFERDHADSVILNRREWAEAQAIADAVRRNKLAEHLLFEDTIIEQRIDWTYLGRVCRSTPDARGKEHVVDLKTSMTSQPGRFTWQAIKMHYHAQLAFYLDAIEHETKRMLPNAYIIAVEKSAPNPVTVLRLTERAIEQGRRHVRLWFESLLGAELMNEWPEYTESIVDLDIPDEVEEEPFEIEVDGKTVEL